MESDLSPNEFAQLSKILNSENAFGRLHALWILEAKNTLTTAELDEMLKDDNPGVLENALTVSESYLNHSEDIFAACLELLSHQNQRVRMLAALTISTADELAYKAFRESILEAGVRSSNLDMDVWNEVALTLATQRSSAKFFRRILTSSSNENLDGLLNAIAGAASSKMDDVSSILSDLSSNSYRVNLVEGVVGALSKHLKTSDSATDLVPFIVALEKEAGDHLIAELTRLRSALNLPPSRQFMANSKDALQKVTDNAFSDEERLEWLSLIDLLPYSKKSEVLFQLLSNKEAISLQEESLKQLWACTESEIGQILVNKWAELGPRARRSASNILLYKEAHHDALLTGLENGLINIGEMNFDLERRRTLLWWTDNANTKRRAEALFSDAGVVNRQDVIEEMKPALELQGSIEKGITVFEQQCAQCHLYEAQGADVGPVLTEINRKSKESLVHDIFDPNAAVDTRYINHRIETNDGSLHIGIVDTETDTEVSIKKMGGAAIVVPKDEIKELRSLGTSMMLEGLEANMSHQDLADLLAYLQKS